MARLRTRRELHVTALAAWQFITEFIDDNGFAPTQGEIAVAVYVGRTSVKRHLDNLEMAGIIETVPITPRALRLLKRHPDVPEPEKAYMGDDGR